MSRDGSVIYGNNEEGMNKVRTFKEGKLKIFEDGLLQHDEKGIPISGDVRNGWAGFSLLQALFVKEHNSVCDLIKVSSLSQYTYKCSIPLIHAQNKLSYIFLLCWYTFCFVWLIPICAPRRYTNMQSDSFWFCASGLVYRYALAAMQRPKPTCRASATIATQKASY